MRISDWSSDVCSSDLSGTTGFPKGVMRTHESLRALEPPTEWLGITSTDRILGHLPLFHVSGVLSCFLPALLKRAALVQVQRSAARRVGQACVSTCRSRWSPYH